MTNMDIEVSASSGESSKHVAAPKKDRLKYQKYYCEENVWQLLYVAHVDCPCNRNFNENCLLNKWAVVLASNKRRQCPLWHHRETDEDELVVWDYHVFACTRLHVYDYDSTLPWPCDSVLYAEKTFRYQRLNPLYYQRLHVVNAKDYYNKFTSDRRHMLNDEGNFLHAPPPWPLINDPVLTDSKCVKRTIDDINLAHTLVSSTDSRALMELQTLLYIDEDDKYFVIANVRSVTASPTDFVAAIERVTSE